jgi:hypothetical protein
MMRARLLFVLFALYSTGIAHATIGPPVRIRVLELPESPQVGSVASIRVAIDLMPGVQIDGLRIAGDSWSILDAGLPASMKTLTSESTEFTIRAIPSRLDAPLRMEYEVAGSAYATTIRLTPRIGGKSGRARQVRRLEPHEVVESTHPVRDWMLPEPTPIDEADSPESDNEEGFSQKAPRNIRVHGRFVYQRENPNLTTSTVGVDAMTFRVYDDDFVGRQLLANGLTDSDGNFDVTFYWNQCCEADPDLYIEFETSNTIVSVEEPVLGFNYVWVTGTTQNYSGTDLSYGSVQSIEEADQPAFHIHNTVMRTWRWIVVNEGYNTGHVNVQWPADWSPLDVAIHDAGHSSLLQRVLRRQHPVRMRPLSLLPGKWNDCLAGGLFRLDGKFPAADLPGRLWPDRQLLVLVRDAPHLPGRRCVSPAQLDRRILCGRTAGHHGHEQRGRRLFGGNHGRARHGYG